MGGYICKNSLSSMLKSYSFLTISYILIKKFFFFFFFFFFRVVDFNKIGKEPNYKTP